MNIEEFPTKEEVIKSINSLKKITFPIYEDGQDVEEFVEKISEIIRTEFGFLFTPITPFKTKDFLSRLFRAREVETFTNINLIREHSYPPIGITKKGRCNFPKFPVFYCSDNPLTAVLEIARDRNDLDKNYCISKWEVRKSDDFMMFENFLQTDLPEENQYKLLKDGLKEKISSPFKISFNKELEKTQEEGLIEYLEFLNLSFLNDSNYSLSATLAHKSLYAKHNMRTDALMYPSVKTQLKGVNLAIQPNFVENFLKLTRLYIVKLNNYNSAKDTVDITISKYATVKKNVIFWSNLNPNDKIYNQMIKDDFGEMIINNFIEN